MGEIGRQAFVIGNSDGIGLAVTRKLLAGGYRVTGISRSPVPIDHPALTQYPLDVTAPDFGGRLDAILDTSGTPDLCLYCAGIGMPFDRDALAAETATFRVNLMGAAVATEKLVERMLARGRGHFIGLSSIMDRAPSREAPAYAASKAGVSVYWEGLGSALAGTGIDVTNVRFGFVDTKMAKAPVRPLMLSADAAADHLLALADRPRRRSTRPRRMALLVWIATLPGRLRQILA